MHAPEKNPNTQTINKIIDDIWIDIFYYVNVNDFLSICQTCIYLNNLTTTINNINKQHQQHKVNNHDDIHHNKNKKNSRAQGIKRFENIFLDIQRHGGNKVEKGFQISAKSVSRDLKKGSRELRQGIKRFEQ